ncbi:MAG: hypothetical protein ACTHL8_02325 [Burkholderiaceae bacterium]
MNIVFRCDPALIDLLPRPMPAKAALPDWLRAMAPRVPSPVHGREIRTVKQCPPFVDAMAHGFVLPLPCDVVVERGMKFTWHWDLPEPTVPGHPRAPLSFHVPEQLAGSPLARGGRSALKFNSFWTVELEPGWSLLAMHPVNRDDLPFRLVTGLVDADRFHDVGINFPAVWVDPDFEGVLGRGTPVAQCCVVPREAPRLVVEAMGEAQVAGYEALADRIMAGPGVYRKGYRSRQR